MVANAPHDLQQAEGCGTGRSGLRCFNPKKINDALVRRSLLYTHVDKYNVIGSGRQQRRHDVLTHPAQQKPPGNVSQLRRARCSQLFDLCTSGRVSRCHNRVAEDVFEHVIIIERKWLDDGTKGVELIEIVLNRGAAEKQPSFGGDSENSFFRYVESFCFQAMRLVANQQPYAAALREHVRVLRKQLVADDAKLSDWRSDELLDLRHGLVAGGNNYRSHPLQPDPLHDFAIPIESECCGTDDEGFGGARFTKRTLPDEGVGDGKGLGGFA